MKRLTKREGEIVELLITGKSNREIAEKLFISVHTVKANLENIYEKFNIHNRVSLAVYLTKELIEKKNNLEKFFNIDIKIER